MMHPTPSRFAQWFTDTAVGLGYVSDVQLSKALDIGTSTISRWKKEGRRPSIGHLIKVANLFGTDIRALLVLAGYVTPEEAPGFTVAIPEPPSAVTETERRIKDAPLDESTKEVLMTYWNARLDEEDSRVALMIAWFSEIEEKGEPPSTEEIKERAPALGETELHAHLVEVVAGGAITAATAGGRKGS